MQKVLLRAEKGKNQQKCTIVPAVVFQFELQLSNGDQSDTIIYRGLLSAAGAQEVERGVFLYTHTQTHRK